MRDQDALLILKDLLSEINKLYLPWKRWKRAQKPDVKSTRKVIEKKNCPHRFFLEIIHLDKNIISDITKEKLSAYSDNAILIAMLKMYTLLGIMQKDLGCYDSDQMHGFFEQTVDFFKKYIWE